MRYVHSDWWEVLYQRQETVFDQDIQHQEESWKYDAQQSIFDEIQSIWIADETLSWVFDISNIVKTKTKE